MKNNKMKNAIAVALSVLLALGFLLAMFGLVSCGGSSRPPVVLDPQKVIEGIDSSGTMQGDLGGMVMPDGTGVWHVAHWPDLVGKAVVFNDRFGKEVRRTVVSKITISPTEGGDLALLKLDRSLDMSRHTSLSIGTARPGMAVTVLRLGREPLAMRIGGVSATRINGTAAWVPGAEANAIGTGTNELRAGDSGKIWVAEVEGEQMLVGMTSRSQFGVSPNLEGFRSDIERLSSSK